MDQEWHETVAREREWLADQLGTPWAVYFSDEKIQIVNVRMEPVVLFNLPQDITATLASEIIKVVNDRY